MTLQEMNVRNIAIVGPYASGKTTLLESLLFVTGSLNRKGKVTDCNTVGDSSAEARDHQMSVEVNAASTEATGLRFNFLDCPGSVEFLQETWNALLGVDAAIVVCECDPERMLAIAPLLKFLDDRQIPHLLFLNKLDRATPDRFRDTLEALQALSSRPVVPHQYPIFQGDEPVGFVDLVSEQAYRYHPGAPADPIPLPEEIRPDESAARSNLLETLADFDDRLLEELLEDIAPSQEEILADLRLDLGADLIVPLLVGCADQDFGVRPLLEVLSREAPVPNEAAERLGLEDIPGLVAQVLKTYLLPQIGKLSLLRLWQGELQDGMSLKGQRISGLYRLQGGQLQPLQQASAGDIVAVGRLENLRTGDLLSDDPTLSLNVPAPLPPVYALAIAPERRGDEVKLSSALNRLAEEDPAIRWEQHGDTHEVILWGQGEIHLQVTLERLRRKYGLPMSTQAPQIPYRETIRKGSPNVHGRYKHQTGGHGQFGDVYLRIDPLPRGSGFQFSESIVGGVVPRQYIPGVEMGVRDYLNRGPLGFPMVDVAVTLTNGSYHSVDSSEQAFRQAARLAMQEGIPGCEPQLLEPILLVEISVPKSFTASVLRLVSGHRGQILGYDSKPDWEGWDRISVYLPQAEMQTIIVELRSATLGVGFFEWQVDHLQEVPEKVRSQIVSQMSR
jgi:elongation factor G